MKSLLNKFYVWNVSACILFVLRESFFPLLCLPAAAEPCTTLIVLKVCHVKTKWAILRFYFISVLSIFFSLISLENIKVVFNEFAFEATLSRVEFIFFLVVYYTLSALQLTPISRPDIIFVLPITCVSVSRTVRAQGPKPWKCEMKLHLEHMLGGISFSSSMMNSEGTKSSRIVCLHHPDSWWKVQRPVRPPVLV